MPVDPLEHEVGATFEAFCSQEDLARAEEIWADIRYGLIAEKHPAAWRVSAVKLHYEDRGQSDIVPSVIGNFKRISDISFDADKISTFANGVKRAKELVWKLTIGEGLEFKGLDVSDLRSDRGREFLSEIETLRDLLDDARVALVGAEMVAERLRNLSRGDKKLGLDRALVGAPVGVMARQLAHVWLGSGYTLAGGRSGDGLDEVIVRIVEKVSGKKDRGSRRWLKDLMTALRDEIPG